MNDTPERLTKEQIQGRFDRSPYISSLALEVLSLDYDASELTARMHEVELAGPYERMRSSFLGGVKRMPIRYRLRPS